MIPEKYHEASNFHTEKITADIEKIFYEKADVILTDDIGMKEHFVLKYGERDVEFKVI